MVTFLLKIGLDVLLKNFYYSDIFSGKLGHQTWFLFWYILKQTEMGLLYTKLYVDFEPDEWKQVSTTPVTFESLKDNVSIEIMDTSQNSYHLQFKKGGKLNLFRVVGKFRLTWDDDDTMKQ